MTKEATQKFGSIYQFGVDYMKDFNSDAATFLAAYKQYESIIKSNGYSRGWDNWKDENQELIIRLHDALEAADLIPKGL